MVGDFEEDDIHGAIKRVFQLIVDSQNPTKDDTCFKKLLDLIRQWVQSPQAVKNSGCLELLRSVASNPVEESVLVFTVELAGTLIEVKGVEEQNSNLIEDLLCHAFSLISAESPSLGTPFFNTLKTILVHGSDYQTELWVKCKGFLAKCWSILEKGKSIFYTNAVVNFLKLYIVSDHCYSSEELESFLYKVESQLHSAKDNITSGGQNDQLTSSCLRLMVLYPDCVNTGTTKAIMQLVESLETIVCTQTSPVVWSLAVDVLLTFSKKFGAEIPMCLKTVNELPAKVAVSDLCKSQRVCTALLESGIVEQEDEHLKLMLCPLHCLHADASGADNSYSLAINQMSDKDRCIKLLWTTLDSLDKLHCIPDRAMECVITLFRLTFDDSVGNTLGSCIRGHIANCRKIQLKCCEIFIQNKKKDEDLRFRIGRYTYMLIGSQRLDSTLYSKCMDVFCDCLSSLLQQPNNKFKSGSDVIEDCDGVMFNCVQRHLCDTEWEIRDTTLEFIRNAVIKYPDDEVVTSWITEGKLCLHAMNSLHDSNSYVRATALQCLTSLLNGRFLQILLQQGEISLAEIVEKVLSILTQDTEAFPRRAAMDLLISCWNQIKTCGEETKNFVYIALKTSTSVDFDWEVKLRTVQFWDRLVKESVNGTSVTQLPSYAIQFKQSTDKFEEDEETGKVKAAVYKLQNLHKIGCLESLLKLLEDYDQSVCKEAYILLIKIKENLLHISTTNDDGSDPPTKKKKVTVKEAFKAAGANDMEQSVCEVISTLDLDKKLREFSVTCDEYDRNPLSLLQDITAHIQAVEKPEEENVVDCY